MIKIIHGHAVYEVTAKGWNLICLHAAGKEMEQRYIEVMNLLEKYPSEFKYIENIQFVS